MKTNRDELLKNAYRLFAQMNYESASYAHLTQATGLTKAGMAYYYPTKQELFVAVIDRYFFEPQAAAKKFDAEAGSFADFVDCFLRRVEQTMQAVTEILPDMGDDAEALSPNFHYFNLLHQIRRYYPGAASRLKGILDAMRRSWREAVERGISSGELRGDIDAEWAAGLFHDSYLGLSFEQSFFSGLDVAALRISFLRLYDLLKAG